MGLVGFGLVDFLMRVMRAAHIAPVLFAAEVDSLGGVPSLRSYIDAPHQGDVFIGPSAALTGASHGSHAGRFGADLPMLIMTAGSHGALDG